MKIKQDYFKLFPTVLNENEFSGLSALISLLTNKYDIIKIKQNELETLFGFGRDRTDQVISSLVEKKFVTREQKRNTDGTFAYNEIKLITNLIN
jgi:hypothetical protein